MRAFDGSFSEGAALSAVAWTGLRNPTIMWTYALSPDPAVLDVFFQQHLLMNVYPMAPMPENDHSIQPGSPVVEQAYVDYAPLFDAMHGAKWLLSAHPVTLSQGTNASTNALTLPQGGMLVPIMLGGTGSTTLQLSFKFGAADTLAGLGLTSPPSSVAVTALYPGKGRTPTVLGNATSGGSGVWTVEVPLVRGCAMVTAVPIYR